MSLLQLRIYPAVVLTKAFIMGVLATLLDIGFWRALILVLVSAIITGVFALVVAYVQLRHDRSLDDRLDRLEGHARDIAGATGATKRATDS